ncbi:MAG: hypothetical protein JXO51_03985 [Candidatus Aminicenantes bacterium]|nr:hypothetical protein [Candidatus Aminicenantes bacterium]
MAFKAVFIAHAPDGDMNKHRTVIDTGRYRLHTCVVQSQAQALQVCRELREKEGIESVLLCPGFTHRDVAELFAALEGKVAVCVARGDGPSGAITAPILQREYYGR